MELISTIGKRRREFVILHAGGGHVDFETIRKNNHGCSEFGIGVDAGPHELGIFFGKSDPVAFDDDVDVFVGTVQEQIPHKSTDHIGIIAEAIWQLHRLFGAFP